MGVCVRDARRRSAVPQRIPGKTFLKEGFECVEEQQFDVPDIVSPTQRLLEQNAKWRHREESLLIAPTRRKLLIERQGQIIESLTLAAPMSNMTHHEVCV